MGTKVKVVLGARTGTLERTVPATRRASANKMAIFMKVFLEATMDVLSCIKELQYP